MCVYMCIWLPIGLRGCIHAYDCPHTQSPVQENRATDSLESFLQGCMRNLIEAQPGLNTEMLSRGVREISIHVGLCTTCICDRNWTSVWGQIHVLTLSVVVTEVNLKLKLEGKGGPDAFSARRCCLAQKHLTQVSRYRDGLAFRNLAAILLRSDGVFLFPLSSIFSTEKHPNSLKSCEQNLNPKSQTPQILSPAKLFVGRPRFLEPGVGPGLWPSGPAKSPPAKARRA